MPNFNSPGSNPNFKTGDCIEHIQVGDVHVYCRSGSRKHSTHKFHYEGNEESPVSWTIKWRKKERR
jgi:hypothetical protein